MPGAWRGDGLVAGHFCSYCDGATQVVRLVDFGCCSFRWFLYIIFLWMLL
jgi:hypothetical protein